MTFYDLVRGLLGGAMALGFPAITLILAYHYARELWIFFSRPQDYAAMKKPDISHGEGSGPAVGTAGRLLFAYPIFILGFGLLTVWTFAERSW